MTHVITGITGFVGSAISLKLLLYSNDVVIGIVRTNNGMKPTQRLHDVLHPLVDAYGLPARLHQAVDERVTAAPGDVWEPGCGVVDHTHLQGAEFWHCAASLQYQDRHREIIERTNIQGAAHALQLARALGCQRFNLISTAYVAGCRSGSIPAGKAKLDGVNNHYERSKVQAENLALASNMPVRILRPGIVIGHSQTRHALNFNGLYGFLRGLVKFRGAMERAQPGLPERLQVKMRVDPEGDLGLVPVDHVAYEAAALSLVDAAPGFYHLTNPTPPTIGDAVQATFTEAGLQPPTLVEETSRLSAIDRKLQQRLDFYSSYMINPKVFDRSSTDAVLGSQAAPGLSMDGERLASFCQWYIERLAAGRAALPVSR